jgi:hypothetical protein
LRRQKSLIEIAPSAATARAFISTFVMSEPLLNARGPSRARAEKIGRFAVI